MKRSDRERIRAKFWGRCAYTGTALETDWKIDHMEPLNRFFDKKIPVKSLDTYENKVPAQKIVNHYKRSHDLEQFRRLMLTFHFRLGKLPRNPKTERSRQRIHYMALIANYFGITPDKPFNGKFYFERV